MSPHLRFATFELSAAKMEERRNGLKQPRKTTTFHDVGPTFLPISPPMLELHIGFPPYFVFDFGRGSTNAVQIHAALDKKGHSGSIEKYEISTYQ